MAPGEEHPSVVAGAPDPTSPRDARAEPPGGEVGEPGNSSPGHATEQSAADESAEDRPKRAGRYHRLRHSIGRRPADLARIAVAAGVVLACVVAARAPGVNEVEVAIFDQIQRLPSWSTRFWQVLTWFGSWPGIIAGTGLALYLGRVRMAVVVASSGVLAWLLVVLLHALVDPRVVDPALLTDALRSPGAEGFPFPSVHTAVIAALVTAAA